MNAKTFNLSVQGASHIKKNKECQDASRSYSDENIAFAIVCDGHGGNDYMRSAVGSICACNAAERNIKNFLENTSKEAFFANPEKLLNILEKSIINIWNQLIYAHYEQNPFLESELSGISEKARKKYVQDKRIESAYGTTLIAVAVTHGYWFGIHIGDGKCVAINPEGKFVQPIPWDKKCFLNATTSICDSDALNSFRHFYSEKLPVAVFVGSDGIDDCFRNNEQLYNLYKTVLYSFGTSEFEKALESLNDYLPRLSARGSGDDVSIAAILDFDLLPELAVVKEFDREKEKARVKENARKEAEKNEEEKKRVEKEHERFQQKNNLHRNITRRPKFCMECGAKLQEGNKYCGKCGTKLQEGNKYCGECGTKLQEGNKYCGECGTKLQKENKCYGECSVQVTSIEKMVETNIDNQQLKIHPAIEYYQMKNISKPTLKQDVSIQNSSVYDTSIQEMETGDIEEREQKNNKNEIELEQTQMLEEKILNASNCNTDENKIENENLNKEQQEEFCELETNNKEDDNLAFEDSIGEVQILNDKETTIEVENIENEVDRTLSENIILEIQKADI